MEIMPLLRGIFGGIGFVYTLYVGWALYQGWLQSKKENNVSHVNNSLSLKEKND
jgi:hypothetical protein